MIKRLLLSAIAACISVVSTWADEPFRLHRYDSFHATPVTAQSIVFVGNSITNMNPWPELFAAPNVVNRGNSGGFSWEILSNVQSFIAKRPAKLFIMIGTNDMNVAGYAPEKVVANVRQTVKHIQKESPATQVYVQSVMASNNGSRTLDKIRELNSQLKAMAEAMGVTYVDHFDATINVANNGGMSYDNLHPHVLGTSAWTGAIAQYVGADAVLPAAPVVNNAGQSNSYGARASVLAQLPVTADDVLFIGDEFVHSGEWQELLGNPNVKNRGTGWGKWGPNIDFQTACMPLFLKGLEANQQPKQVLLMIGSQALTSSSADLEAVKKQYKACIDAVRQNAPSTKLSLVSVIPYGPSATNINMRNLVPFNAWLEETAEASENADFIDLYSVLADGNNTAVDKYLNTDQYVTGLGYQACARELAKHIDGCTVMTEAEAEAYYNTITARTTLSNLIDAVEMNGGTADVEACYAVLAKDDATVAELEEAAASLQDAEYVITVSKASGTTYRNGAVTTSGWVSQWASTQTEPFRLTFGTSYNNMNAATLGIAVGTSSGAWTFSVSNPDYYVHSYSFEVKAGDANQVITPADGKAVSLSTSEFTTIAWQNDEKGQKAASFSFTGANKEATVQNMMVVVRPAVVKPEPQVNVFEFGSPGNNICYRIPAIATAHNGDVISVADYRYGGADIGFGRVSLHARISKDNGATWGDKIVVAESHQGQYGVDKADDLEAGFGDPAIVADRESDNVLLLSCCGNVSYPGGTWAHHQGIARFRSADNGQTWSKYEDIAPGIYQQFKDAGVDVQAMFVGSGRIFQSRFTKIGKYYRLYCVVLLRTAAQGGLNYVLYSDDFGENWLILGDDATPGVTSGDEPKAEELPDGSVLLSSRTQGRIFNIFQFTDVKKGEGTWMQQAWSDGNSTNGTVAQQNACNGEIMIVPVVRAADSKKMWLAMQSIPYGPGRTNVSIYYKGLASYADFATPTAFANNWEGRYQTSNISSGYSTMTLQHDNTIGFLFEESTFGKDYTIVYKNYTIEAITGGAYTIDAEPTDPFVLTADGIEAKTVGLRFSEFVGGIKESARAGIDAAVAAFKAGPTMENYLAINQTVASAERVELDPAVQYILRNVGRGTAGSLAMSVPATSTLKLASSTYSKNAKRQQWTFVPAGEEGVWNVYNEVTNSYLMNTLAVEVDMYTTTDRDKAGTYRIQGQADRLCLVCTQPANGTYPAVHLPANTARMVCWTTSGEASQWYIEPTEVPAPDLTPIKALQQTSVETPIYDLQGRPIARPVQHGIYIQNRRKRAM